MIKYYKNLILSLSEISGHPSLLIHGLMGCAFHCYHCFNYDEIIANKPEEYYTIEDVIRYISKQQNLFDYIIFSGGEFLLASIDDLIEDLSKVKSISGKPIIVYTTGIEYGKIKRLHELQLVDGFHMDMKLPYHLLSHEDKDLIELTMGIKVKDLSLFSTMLQSLDYIIKTDRGHSRFRSVAYPFVSESAFEENRLYINELNRIHGKNVPYDVNPFVYVECQKESLN